MAILRAISAPSQHAGEAPAGAARPEAAAARLRLG
jgi:hypothetical protein